MSNPAESRSFLVKWNDLNIDAHLLGMVGVGVPPLSGHFIADPTDATNAANTENVLTVPQVPYIQARGRPFLNRRAHIMQATFTFGGTVVTSVAVQICTSRKNSESTERGDVDADRWTENGDSLQIVRPIPTIAPAAPVAGVRDKIRIRTDGSLYLGMRFGNKVGGAPDSTVDVYWEAFYADLGDIT